MINLDAPLNRDEVIAKALHVIVMMKNDIAMLQSRVDTLQSYQSGDVLSLAEELNDIATASYDE